MKTRIRIAFTIVLLIALGILANAIFVLLNIPSTVAVLLGIAITLFTGIFVPTLFVRIWRKKTNESQTTDVN